MPETVAPKPGRHREASLYHALHGAGAGLAGREGRSPEAIREAAQLVFEASELPVWRRSGFWTTSLQELDLDELEVRSHAPGALPELVRAGLPERGGPGAGVAGRIVQLDGSVVHVELDPALAERGVVLCSLEEALRDGDERAREHFSKRLTYDRHKLEAANAAFWTGGAYLYVPPGVAVAEPFEIVYAIEDAGVAQYGRSLVVGDRASDFRVHEHNLAGSFEGQSLHAGAFELYLHDGARCRLAQVQDWSAGEVYDVSTRFVGVGRDAYCHWLPSLLGGRLVRQHLELAVSEPGGDMAFRGLFFSEGREHLDAFAVDLHETGPSGGDVHWRGAATGESRSLVRGAHPDRPRRPADAYLSADSHDGALAEGAPGCDPLGAGVGRRRVGLARRHGGRAGRERDLLHAVARPGSPDGGATAGRGLLRAGPDGAARRAAGRAGARQARRQAGVRARGHRGVCHQSLAHGVPRRLPVQGVRQRTPGLAPVNELAGAPSLDVRGEFPIFARRFDGHELVYLDSAATSQKPAVVIEALATHLREHNANVHRGVYALAQEADAAYDGARASVAAFVGADPQCTIFTKNATEAINLVAYAWGRAHVGSGDAVLITEMEHHANLVPWQVLCRERGATLRYLEIDERGELSLAQLDAELARGDVRLVAFAHVSNVLGTINPVAEMVARAHRAGALTLIDGAQAVPHMPVDVAAIGADFYAWTGHKALGPTGIGVLHGRREVLERMDPFITGGDMIASVELQSASWRELPYRFEAGTPPIAEAVGLGAAVEYLQQLGMGRVRAHEQGLTAYMLERLAYRGRPARGRPARGRAARRPGIVHDRGAAPA